MSRSLRYNASLVSAIAGGVDVDANTVGEYLFDEASGNRLSNFPGGPALVEQGTISRFDAGGGDFAVDFVNSSSNWLASTDAVFNFAANADASFSISVYARADASTGGTQTVVSRYDNDISLKSYTIDWSNGAEQFFCRVSADGSATTNAVPPGSTAYGAWVWIDMRFTDNLDSTGTVEIRLDGGAWTSSAFVGDLFSNPTTFFMLGGGHDSNNPGTGSDKKSNLDGAIRYLRVWDAAVSNQVLDAVRAANS